MRTFYSLLGCEEQISGEELKKLYFNLLRQFHPDRSGSKDFDNFLAINKAWNVLRSRESRRLYDCWLREQCFRESKELIGEESHVSDLSINQFGEQFCRCGGTYEELTPDRFQLVLDYILLECSNCSLCLKVWRVDEKKVLPK